MSSRIVEQSASYIQEQNFTHGGHASPGPGHAQWFPGRFPLPTSLTIGETVLKESDDPVIFGVKFDSKMIFEKHLCSVSEHAATQ